jgi:hypothetical protein
VNKTAGVALAIVAIIAAIIVVLATGGGDRAAENKDQLSDVTVGDGPGAPPDTSLADIAEATAHKEGNGDIVFEVTMGSPIPSGGDSSLSLRWDLSQNGADTWLVTANFDDGPVASISSIEGDYGSSTIDNTMPGSVSATADSVTITVKAGEIEGFPASFAWRVTSTLDADRADPASAVATDTAPDTGPAEIAPR